jgi:hypothetical protein
MHIVDAQQNNFLLPERGFRDPVCFLAVYYVQKHKLENEAHTLCA